MTFACDGKITLANTLVITNDTVLDASGRELELTGGEAVRVIFVEVGVRLSLLHLSLTEGRSSRGGALYNDGGIVMAAECAFARNQARGADGVDASPVGETALGGAIYSSGTMVLSGCVLSTNSARGGRGASYPQDLSVFDGFAGGEGRGGALYSTGTVIMNRCVVEGNQAVGGTGGSAFGSSGLAARGGGGGGAFGAGIAGVGEMRLTNCLFAANEAVAGDGGTAYLGGQGGDAGGGAVHSAFGSIHQDRCSFVGNRATAGHLGGFPRTVTHGRAGGGAVSVITGTVTVARCVLATNSVAGEAAQGGGLSHTAGVLALTQTRLSGNQALGYPADTYYGRVPVPCLGGGLFTGATTEVSECTIEGNAVAGSPSRGGFTLTGAGGAATGGGICSRGVVHLRQTTLLGNEARGGAGAIPWLSGPEAFPGGAAQGGGMAVVTGVLTLENCTVSANSALGGRAPGPPEVLSGVGGDALGGAIHVGQASNWLQHCTVAGNGAYGGDGGAGMGQAYGGGISVVEGGVAAFQNSIIAQNCPGGDIGGSFTGDHNLIGVDARLDSPAFNGGTTWTMALLPGSPAIDAGISTSLAADQRGCARPFGPLPDIGAFEYNAAVFTNFILHLPQDLGVSGWRIVGSGPPATPFRLETSNDLELWTLKTTNATQASGWFELLISREPTATAAFYRVATP